MKEIEGAGLAQDYVSDGGDGNNYTKNSKGNLAEPQITMWYIPVKIMQKNMFMNVYTKDVKHLNVWKPSKEERQFSQ